MKCGQIRKLIEEFHDRELGARSAAEVADHVRECPACREELALLEAETRIYDAYAASIRETLEVPANMSERIVDAVAGAGGPPPGRRRPVWTEGWLAGSFLAASPWARNALAAVFLIAVSVAGTLLAVRHYNAAERGSMRQQGIEMGIPGNMSLDAAFQSIQHAEQEYLNAIQILSAVVEKEKPTWDPRIVAEFQDNMRLIDEHIAATRKAYYAHPKDAELALYMLAAYSRKVQLLQDLTS